MAGECLRDSAVAQLLLSRYKPAPEAAPSDVTPAQETPPTDTAIDLSASASKAQVDSTSKAPTHPKNTSTPKFHIPYEPDRSNIGSGLMYGSDTPYQPQFGSGYPHAVATVSSSQDRRDNLEASASRGMQQFVPSKRFRVDKYAPYDSNSSQSTSNSPNLRALLRKFDENNRERIFHENTRSVLHDYLQSTRTDAKSHNRVPKLRKVPYNKPSATISSPTQLTPSYETLIPNTGLESEVNFCKSATGAQKHPNSSVVSIPPLAMIGEVVDKEFDIQRTRCNSDNADPIWIKEEPDWEIAGAQLQDPKAAYILQNLRAGIREQQHKAKTEVRDEDTEIVITSANLKNYASRFQGDNVGSLNTENEMNRTFLQDPCPDIDHDNQGHYANLNQGNIVHSSDGTGKTTVIKNQESATVDVGIQCVLLVDQAVNNIVSKPSDVTTTSTTSQPNCVITEAQEGVSFESRDNTCVHCNISFNDAVLHSIHMGCHNLNAPFLCNICGIQCSDKYGFYTHIMRGHNTS